MRGDTILETATKVGHGEIFMLLFCHAINTRKKLEPTMLHTAADNCHSLIIQIILGKRKDWVNEVDHKDRTALFIAARYGDLETAQVLIACGANLEILCNGCTALQIASAFGHVGFAKLLLDSGAGIEDSGPGRNTPLIEASTHGNLAMVMLLIAWGADLNARSRKRGTALAYATYHQQHEVVKYLRQVGA
ncbi:ankyrin repeat-containing domain protein, partial [Halenospora varia]